ncbi:hypothetical protein HZH68_006063 [Vespula germanica]|uniref:Reverse transcriptase domain-containing protein n=1 Tax=Vespula germanica TaxID=30212 RepID=A0A834KA45_VESGE|nr:hypothetical protein HZH68_006063 [Vespula germanica]
MDWGSRLVIARSLVIKNITGVRDSRTRRLLVPSIQTIDDFSSDHLPVLMKTNLRILYKQPIVLTTKLTNWDGFRDMSLSYFPVAWKCAKIILIPKPGKSSITLVNYKPISLLPTIFKILEKIIYLRMYDKCQNIPNHQVGFRKYHGTIEQIQKLVNKIAYAFLDKTYNRLSRLRESLQQNTAR